ncbi:uncharacterized protein LOC134629737 [Pelmatolapia mariae]|uniref:uncharacterized protein LOC134629737 n=1 Tax=Pelmatolapia mariae TaxID=158779 RepID=UPI002FE63624
MSEHYRESYYGSSSSDLRLLLLGNIGCGKTALADTILAQLSPISPGASRSCQLRQGFIEGRNVTLVEAPRWYWSGGKMEDGVKKETQRAMTLVPPGPHAILLLVPVNQFTEVETRVPAELEELFGQGVLDHTMVILTCGDYLMGKTVEEYLQKEHPGLRQVIECCGGWYHVINNRQRQDKDQVRELLEKVDNMARKNGLYYMKTVQDRELEKRVKEKKEQLMESFWAQKEEKKKTHTSSYTPNAESQEEEYFNAISRERRRRQEVKEEMVEGVKVSQVSNEYVSAISTDSRRTREEMEEMVDGVKVSQVSSSLYSTPALERQPSSELCDNRELKRTPSFKLNRVHYRINSFEERSPEALPTTTPHSPVFSSFPPSSPTFAASPSLISSSSSTPSSPSLSSSSSSPELRLVLLGRSGSGKSAAGNEILGQEAFESCPDSLIAITQWCEKKKALVKGRRVAVVDTPDWFNSERTPDEVRAQISSCVALSSPGPHVFLFCVPLDQPAKTELQALAALEAVFGPEAVWRHTLVLFTYADRLRASGKAKNKNIEAYIAGQRGDLLKIVEKCGDRFHVLETERGGGERSNVADLLEKVEQTVKEAGGQCYSCPAFQEAENRVRQKQQEMAREKRGENLARVEDVGPLSSERRKLYPYMQSVSEVDEEVTEDEIEKTRDEAEMSVSTTNIESLPPITRSTISPSLLSSIMEKMSTGAKNLPKLLADSSVWVGEGAQRMKNSEMWEKVGTSAQSIQKMVVDSSVWEKVGVTAGNLSKAVGNKVPKVVVDGSAWVGSGAKAAAASPMWEKVGSGAKVMAESSMRVGAGIGAGAKNLAQSPVWGKVGSGAKAGAKMVAESSVWEKIGNTAKQVPKVVIGGALLGLVLGVFLGGVIGGAVGAAAGSAVTEVGRRKLSKRSTREKTEDAARNVDRTVNKNIDAVRKQGEKFLKTE